jgi:ubiquinone/menaquinone biosynthesis C-methylase UbiE
MMSIENAYNSWAEQYDTNLNKTRDLDQKTTIKILSKYDFKTVLELGCGTGKNTEWLCKKANRVLAMDFSAEMLKKAQTKIISNNVQFLKADLNKKWSIENDFANLITINLTLEHINNLDFVFEQAHQKLQNNGLFFICELHPFKQYSGSKARFETENGIEKLEVFTHHISDYLIAAKTQNFKLIALNEWFDDDDTTEIPRLISFVFKK